MLCSSRIYIWRRDLEPRSYYLAELPIRYIKLLYRNVELDIKLGLRVVRGAYLIDENALRLVDADLIVGG